MDKKNIILITVAVLALAVIFGFAYPNRLASIFSFFNKPVADASAIILFYGDGCLHCKTVDDFISQNNIEEKVKFSYLEVFNNKDNVKILLEKVQACNLDVNEVGVPFLWTGSECLMGDEDVINFFEQQAGIDSFTGQ